MEQNLNRDHRAHLCLLYIYCQKGPFLEPDVFMLRPEAWGRWAHSSRGMGFKECIVGTHTSHSVTVGVFSSSCILMWFAVSYSHNVGSLAAPTKKKKSYEADEFQNSIPLFSASNRCSFLFAVCNSSFEEQPFLSFSSTVRALAAGRSPLPHSNSPPPRFKKSNSFWEVSWRTKFIFNRSAQLQLLFRSGVYSEFWPWGMKIGWKSLQAWRKKCRDSDYSCVSHQQTESRWN